MYFVLPLVILLLPANVYAAEAGYSLTDQRTHESAGESARGLEGRINFGNKPGNNRYSGDRWSLGIGYMKARGTGDGAISAPGDALLYTEKLPAYWYVNFTHRWYTKPNRFKFAPQLRLFVGTGVSWRDVETCALDAWGTRETYCWDGTAEVSSPWAFHQSMGFKWRERLELAWEHDSTGGFSEINLGDDVIRFTIYALLSK